MVSRHELYNRSEACAVSSPDVYIYIVERSRVALKGENDFESSMRDGVLRRICRRLGSWCAIYTVLCTAALVVVVVVVVVLGNGAMLGALLYYLRLLFYGGGVFKTFFGRRDCSIMNMDSRQCIVACAVASTRLLRRVSLPPPVSPLMCRHRLLLLLLFFRHLCRRRLASTRRRPTYASASSYSCL